MRQFFSVVSTTLTDRYVKEHPYSSLKCVNRSFVTNACQKMQFKKSTAEAVQGDKCVTLKTKQKE